MLRPMPELYGTRWAIAGLRNGWTMPTAPWWKRLPVIRHIRVAYHAARLVIWRKHWEALGYVPNGEDDWILAGMWRALEAGELLERMSDRRWV